MVQKAGRPKENKEARKKLLLYASECFTTMPYEKVSTRLLAEKAGVNVAMIRYYFGSKEGLFEEMVRETIEPVLKKALKLVNHKTQQDSQEGLIEVMRTYYHTMLSAPNFPKLLVQIMNMGPNDSRRKRVEALFLRSVMPAMDTIFKRMMQADVIRPGLDGSLCRMTFMSLMIFPFIAPQAMLNLHGIELNEKFLQQLLSHNIQILKHGLFLPELSANME